MAQYWCIEAQTKWQPLCRPYFQVHFPDNVIKWKHFPHYWPFVGGIHWSPVNSPHKGQWRGALMFALICARINGSVNNRETGDLRRHRAHYDAIVISCIKIVIFWFYLIPVAQILIMHKRAVLQIMTWRLTADRPLSCSCLCSIHWSQVLSPEWRCSWSSANRRCSNYIWIINNFIDY